MVCLIRPGGTSRFEYHKPALLRVTHERGTDSSKTITSLQLFCFMVCRTAHGERLAACNQTTGSLPLLLEVSRPRRWIDAKLRDGVACRSFMGESFRWGERGEALSR